MKQSNTTPATVRAALSRFSERYIAAHNAEVGIQDRAYEAFVTALSYLECFTAGDNGLTPAQAKELYQLLESVEDLWGAPGSITPAQVVDRFETEILKLIARSEFR